MQMYTTENAHNDLAFNLSTKATRNWIELVSAITQELGLTLAYSIDPDQTAKIKALQGILEPSNFSKAVDIYLSSLGISKDLEQLERYIHQKAGQLFVKHQDKQQIKPGMTVSNTIN